MVYRMNGYGTQPENKPSSDRYVSATWRAVQTIDNHLFLLESKKNIDGDVTIRN